MNAYKDLPVNKKIHITEQPNDIKDIVCKAIFGKCTKQVIDEDKIIDKKIDKTSLLVLSSIGKENCTLAYQRYLKNECDLHLLEHLDFEESFLDKGAIFRLTFYNLELFRRKSIRSKSNFIINTTINQIKPENYKLIIDENLADKNPTWYLHLYRVIAFESNYSLNQILLELNDCELEISPLLIDSIIKLAFYSNSEILLCNLLINYYIKINYAEDDNKSSIFLILTQIYKMMGEATVQKINCNSIPILSYCLSEDLNGKYLEMLKEFIKQRPSTSKNLLTLTIVIYANIFRNESYRRFFYTQIEKPTNKFENMYYKVLQKVGILLKQNEHTSIPPLQFKKGVDEYLMFLQGNFSPDKPSPLFHLLDSQSTTE